MGRDFTPYEHHMADLKYGFSKKPIILENTKTGKQTVYRDPTCADAVRWPNSYFLAEAILKEHSSEPEKLDMFERALTKIVEASNSRRYTVRVAETPLEKTVCDWYYGKLDPHFYYSGENDRAMSEALSAVII